MKQLRRFGRFLKNANKKKLALGITAGAVLAIAGTGGVLFATTKIAEAKMARDCDGNAIMYCGAVNNKEFVDKYKKNSTGDLDNIYAHYGLSTSEAARFEKTAKLGYVTKSGNVVLDGRVVGTGAQSVGRHNIAGSAKVSIDGKTYYQRSTKIAFASDSIPAMIMMNGEQVEFVALTACGNPVKSTPKGKPPVYKCDMLNKEAVAGKSDTFAFSTKAAAQYGAKISKVVYNFGDGSAEVTKTNPAEKINHTYKPGKFTAKVTVYFTVNGETKTSTSADCSKPVEVKAPPVPVYACSALTAQLVPNSKSKYTFTATAKAENGAVAQTADFDFGDGQKQNGVAVNNLKATAQHDYSKTGASTAFVTFTFNVGGTTKTAKCEVAVKPEIPQPAYECTGLAVTQKSRTEFSFKASSKVENAELLRYRYAIHSEAGVEAHDLGPNEVLTYTAAKEGAYTVNAQAIVKVDGVEKETPITNLCSKQFEVKPEEVPVVTECTSLIATLKNGTRNTYDYAVSTKVEGKDAKVVSYTYDYGDGQQQTLTAPTASHAYGKAGNWKSKVTVTFEVKGEQVQKTSAACTAETPVLPQECKPGIPVGDERCTDYCKPGIPVGDSRCQEECKPGIPVGDSRCKEECKPGVPMGSSQCTPTCENGGKSMQECQPKELPQTGPEAALGGLFGTSALAGAAYYYRDSRRKLANRFLKRK